MLTEQNKGFKPSIKNISLCFFRAFAIDMNMFMFLPKQYREIDLSKFNKPLKPDILNGTESHNSETITKKND